MFDAVVEEIEASLVVKYRLYLQKQPVSYRQFIHAMVSDGKLRNSFNTLLSDAPFDAYRLETPALSLTSLDSPFEFVLINAPGLLNRTVDSVTFAEYFSEDKIGANATQSIVKFKSLGGDATMIVPSPRSSHETYNHLASFVRTAPAIQIDALWQVVGQLLDGSVSAKPLWWNTEGSGVAWLHVRLDTWPKYYGYERYTVPL